MAPCWAAMLAFQRRLKMASFHLQPKAGNIAWIADDTSKPGRPTGFFTYVIHATPEWSRANIEAMQSEVCDHLLSAMTDICGPVPPPSYIVAHRWRYALVEKAVGTPSVWDPEARIGACGDWCIGPRIEDAFTSGQALARQIIEDLGRNHES